MVAHSGVTHDHTKQGIHPNGTGPHALFVLRHQANPLYGSSSHVLALAALAIPTHQLAHVFYSPTKSQTTLTLAVAGVYQEDHHKVIPSEPCSRAEFQAMSTSYSYLLIFVRG